MEFGLEDREADVPSALRHGQRLLPLGRYLQKRLRVMVGRDEKAPAEVLEKYKEELRPLREAAFDNSLSLKSEIVRAADQAVLNMEARARIFKQRRKL